MSYDDVRSFLRYAQAGDTLQAWRGRALTASRLLAGSRRDSQLRIATTIVRPVGDRIVDERFLVDLADADEPTARDLIYGRYLTSVGIAVALAERYLRIAQTDAPQETITRASIEAFLRDVLPTCSESTRARTRTAIGAQFSAAGITRVERDGTLVRIGRRPAPIAIWHILRSELEVRREASDTWLAQHSLAAAIFAVAQPVFAEIIEQLIDAGRLRRSYYAGEPRVLAA